ncbi:phosphatidate cytidylyltransferase [Hylemonella gracilis]|uniref:Phosphatidate cytidylyltransferase n=1 Tax=Hylemonella gracilis TaxID=80880 RepID=A0A4V1A282_9BURK|nr:phosphatidate cytidylyltransferase [Hylemonella gracilis]QBK05139.1 phosphatidate cytidylyltransferase [Hylemonella gracilis]
MLKQRVITAIVLLALLLPALFHPDTTYWRLAALVLIAGGAWEWGRLNDPKQGRGGLLTWVGVVLCVAACVLSWFGNWSHATPGWIWGLGGLLWVLAGAALLRMGVSRWATLPRALRLIGGWAALWLTWLAVVRARELGIAFLLSVLVLVWVADIAAYFAGKAFGGRFTSKRLAPSISPNKSWEGAWGGLLGVLVLALAWLALERSGVLPGPSLYGVLGASSAGAVGLALALIFLTAMSVVGDLVESLVKRSAGMKDSSGLLPGHGGVLDRVDALLPTLPLALMLQSLAR